MSKVAKPQKSKATNQATRQVWRLITHHEEPEEALRWSLTHNRIAVGWNFVGDVTGLTRDEILDAARLGHERVYPDTSMSVWCVPSLYSLCNRMQEHDYVILGLGFGRRDSVVEVVGPYEFVPGPDEGNEVPGNYHHQRRSQQTNLDANVLWRRAGGLAKGENIRNTLVLCRNIV